MICTDACLYLWLAALLLFLPLDWGLSAFTAALIHEFCHIAVLLMLLKGGGGGCHPKEKSVFTSLTETDVSECLFQSSQSFRSHDHRRWTSFSLSTVLFLSRQVSLVMSH